MKPAESLQDRVWRALAEPTRRQVIDLLAGRPMTTGELVEALPQLCRTAVMKHLDVLVAAELVVVRRQGRKRWNHFNPVPIDRVCGRWLDTRRRLMSTSLNRLRQFLESEET